MSKELRSGYTTGTHATAVFLACLYEYYEDKYLENLEVILPKGDKVIIDVKREKEYVYSSIKTDNDDLDVTKGCYIDVSLSKTRPMNLKVQEPTILEINKTKIYVYAGDGIGIVTKKGLKIEPNFPAINPVPLDMMKINSRDIIKDNSDELYVVFSVKNGEIIAKDTANAKVGVIGGISILGTRGIVKPISADAYLDSIKAEVSVANASGSKDIVYTLGNTAHDYANANYDETIVVEIGNFIYDGAAQLVDTSFEKMIFISSVAKMCKIAQACKNTHNRFGGINFDEVKLWLKKEIDVDLGSDEYLTLKAVLQKLYPEQKKLFISFLAYKASENFKKWLLELKINIKNIEIITLNGKNIFKRELKW